MSGYRTIVIDPPWPYAAFPATGATGRDRRISPSTITDKPLPYPSMGLDALAALPILPLADPTGARLWLWATNRYLPHAFDLIHTWGFAYRQAVVWHKLGGTPFSTHCAPNSAEYLLVATIGAPGRIANPWRSSVIAHGVPKAHSRKPEVFLDLIEQVSGAPRLEMFARRQRLGWDTWGDEALNHVQLGGAA